MKKLLVLLFVLLSFPQLAMAVTNLACDCTPATDKVLSFQLQFGTAAWIDSPAVLTCGSVICTGDQRTVCYDLTSLPSGPFTVKGRAVNVWGVSADSLPLVDTKVVPTSPSSLKIVH